MSVIGHAGANEGQVFDGRASVREAGLHRHLMRGISGTEAEPADAIVLSGGYQDDLDLGDEIIYTGEGGRDAATNAQISDQSLTGGNAALANSHLDGSPVRVIRKTGNGHDYRYDGLYYVDRYWAERPEHGHLIWRFRLLKAMDDGESVVAPGAGPAGAPERIQTLVQRVVRTTSIAQAVKRLHGDYCQLCGTRVDLPLGRSYSEAAHITPLGLPYNGPDVISNVLCLCPIDHVRFDHGAIYVESSGRVVDAVSGLTLGQLRTVEGHPVSEEHLAAHRERWTNLQP